MFPPEVLAPAGSEECIKAAVQNGADAVYFGLKNFSARARAQNFDAAELARTMKYLHRHGVRGYVALNTLLFNIELPIAETAIRTCAEAGVDALIVQDLGIAKLAKEIAPWLSIHASTQMTLSSAEGINLVKQFGIQRVILARELTIDEISKIKQNTDAELEVFVHGALCVAYSGQCLTSEAWGGRSANRGECAQACRQPYQMFSDGNRVDTNGRDYLLSPQDLQATPLIPDLIRAGVSSIKIEGRLKGPEYVANTTASYRRAVDLAIEKNETLSPEENQRLAQSFSRGPSMGFLGGINHQVLVEGRIPSNRGILLGTVLAVQGWTVKVRLEATVSKGDGVMFEGDNYERGFEGGRVFGVRGTVAQGQIAELVFGEPGPNLQRVKKGCRIFKTDDPNLDKQLRASFEGEVPKRRTPLDFMVEGKLGEPLSITVTDPQKNTATVQSQQSLVRAEKHPLTAETLKQQLGRLGDVPYVLGSVEVKVEQGLMLPISELNRARRALVEQIDEARQQVKTPTLPIENILPALLDLSRLVTSPLAPLLKTGEGERSVTTQGEVLTVVCRTMAQVEAAAESGADVVVIDFQDFVGARRALEAVKHKVKVAVATPRIQKPDEIPLHRNIASWEPDAILVRSLGALHYYRENFPQMTLWGDFSLNVANSLSASVLASLGLSVLVPSYDLDQKQLLSLAASHGPMLEVTVHQHMPLFHMEHCVFAAFLSKGKDYRDCGRPCETQQVTLKDPIGMVHPLVADVGCRNTVFSGQAQSGASMIPELQKMGVKRYRIELAHHQADEVQKLVSVYREVLEQKRDGANLWKELKAKNQVGTCHGTLYVLSAPGNTP
jgi:putative protease